MNILFISPSNAVGGAERSLLQMADYLQRQGHRVFVALPPSNDTRFEGLLRACTQKLFFIPLLPWNKIRGGFLRRLKGWTYRFYHYKGGWFYAVPKLLQIIRRHKIDLVHTNTIMALDGAIAAKIAGIPHVQHLREITGYGPDALFPMLWQRNPALFYQLMLPLHTVLIANSFYTKKSYVSFFKESNIQVIYNALDAGEADRSKSPGLRISLVANVTSKIKNHRLFVQIAAALSRRLPEATFHIYGKLPAANDPYLLDLQQLILQSGIADTLTFEGLQNDIPAIYRQTTVLIHTYPYESFGRIFIEAMAYGVPVVAVRGGGADELIRDGENGFLFEKENIQTAVAQVLRLCNDPALYSQITAKGRAFAQQFEGEVVGRQLTDLYRHILPS